MKLSGIGFFMALIGLGGLAEAYGNMKAVIISIALIGIGAFLIAKGEKNETDMRSDRDFDSHVMDRLHFLRS